MSTLSPASAEPRDWNTFYAGVSAGAAFGDTGVSTVVDCIFGAVLCAPDIQEDNGAWIEEVGSGRGNGTAWIGGAFIGWNWQAGRLLLGVEGDVSAMPLDISVGGTAQTVNEGLYNEGIPSVFTMMTTVSTDWLATTRGRIGFLPTPGLLLYGTAGLAATELTVTNSFRDNFDNGVGTGNREYSRNSQFRTAFVVGGGAEWAFAERWTLRTEYLFTDLGSISTTGISTYLPQVPNSNPITSTADLRVHIVRLGLAYGF